MLSEEHIPHPRKSCGARHLAPRLIKLSYVAPPFVLNKEQYEAEGQTSLICINSIFQLKSGVLLGLYERASIEQARCSLLAPLTHADF